MADDLNNSTALTSSDDSIRSALMAAVAEHEGKSSDDAGNAAGDGAVGGASDGKSRASTPADKAASEAADTPEGEAPEASADKPEDAADKSASETDTAEKPVASGTEPPSNWKADEKEEFKQLSPKLQQTVLRREKEREALLGRRLREIDAFKHEFTPVEKMLEPYRDRMKAAGYTPGRLMENYLNVERRLMEGDGVNVVAGLVRAYQINPGQLAQALGFRPRQPATNGNGAAQPGEPEHQAAALAADDPVVRHLQSIQARLDAEDRARMNAARRQQTDAETRVMSEIDQFKSAVDDKGNLLHPHFDEVETDMFHLAQSANAAGKPRSLKDLYETAVWANTSTREATLAARERAQQEKAAEEARAKAAKARKAGSSVTGAPGTGQAPNGQNRADLSLRQQLEAAYNDTVGGRI